MVKVDNSQNSCLVTFPETFETGQVLLHGLDRLMKLKYNRNSDGTWKIRSLD